VWRQVAGEGGASCPAPSPQPARSLSLRVVVLLVVVVVYDVVYLLEHLLSRFYRILRNKKNLVMRLIKGNLPELLAVGFSFEKKAKQHRLVKLKVRV
jgi:hypothetical protein